MPLEEELGRRSDDDVAGSVFWEIRSQYEIVFGIFLLALAFLYREHPQIVIPDLWYVFTGFFGFNFLVNRFLKQIRVSMMLALPVVAANGILISSMVRFSGGTESFLWVLYLLPIFTSCLLFDFLGVAATVVYVLILRAVDLSSLPGGMGIHGWAEGALLTVSAFVTARLAASEKAALVEAAHHRGRLKEILKNVGKEEVFKMVASNVDDLIAVVDSHGRRLYSSPSYRILGDPESLVGTDSFAEIHPEDRPKVREVFEETFRSGVGRRTEYRFLLRNGEVRFIESRGTVIKENGRASKLIVISRDITRRRELERKMRQSETLSALGQLAAGVAHELKNPIGIIRGFAANALRKAGDAGAVLKALKTISRESERCENIVKKLLSFSRENQKEKTEFELAAAMESALSLVEAQANINGVKIHRTRWREFWKSKMRVKGDKSALQQVFINLCGNSMDAMPGGGEITLCVERVRRDGRAFAQLTFTDDGLGMSAEVRARIFEPFYTTKPVGKGTGLGLSMVREVVLEHGGAVECESVEGEGTTFTLWLPLVGDEVG